MPNQTTPPTETKQPRTRAEQARARWASQKQTRSGPPTSKTPSRPRLNLSILFVYLLVIVSLSLNGILIWQLLQVRDLAYNSLEQIITITGNIEQEEIVIPVEINESFPVTTSVPFEYSQDFPIDTTVPVSTTISVPFDIMQTTINVDVPINFVVPVNLSVPVSLSKTFEISTTVPVQFSTEVRVKLSDTPIPGYLEELRALIQNVKFP